MPAAGEIICGLKFLRAGEPEKGQTIWILACQECGTEIKNRASYWSSQDKKGIIYSRCPNKHMHADGIITQINNLGNCSYVSGFVNAETKCLFRCNIHNKEFLQRPRNAARDFKPNCCGSIEGGKKRKLKAASEYDNKLLKIGKVVRVGEYITATTKIQHRCLKHNEVHLATPNKCLSGRGLKCCQEAAKDNFTAIQEKSRQRAASDYDKRIAKFGRVIRVAPYQTARIPILHRCLIHNEEHEAAPDSIRLGKGLWCCYRERLQDSITVFMEDSAQAQRLSYLYVYRSFQGNFFKIGIAFDTDRREDMYYEENILLEQGPRANCWAVEQTILNETMFAQADAKHELIPWSDGKPWGGVTELRDIDKLNETQLLERISELWDECNDLGWQKFAREHEVDGFQMLRDITPSD